MKKERIWKKRVGREENEWGESKSWEGEWRRVGRVSVEEESSESRESERVKHESRERVGTVEV